MIPRKKIYKSLSDFHIKVVVYSEEEGKMPSGDMPVSFASGRYLKKGGFELV